MKYPYTPAFINQLEPNEIFVFGSNLDGMHGGGAARFAYEKFGAVWGEGVGLHGQTYAIPTMQGGVDTIRPYVDEFIGFAKAHPRYLFLVTPIGCGIAGFKEEEIAPLFRAAWGVENIVLPEGFLSVLNTQKEHETAEKTSGRFMQREFQDKVVVITGGAQGIGRCIAERFEEEGAAVCIIDKKPGHHYVGDIADKKTLEAFAQEVIRRYGQVDVIINNALPLMKGIDECTYEEFQYALSVGITAPFYLVKLFAGYLGKGASIVNISSSRDRMSQPQTESYTAAKGGIAALTHALAVSLAGKARVNSISPGWIDTDYTEYKGADARQQPVGRVGNPKDIAHMVLFLCSEKAGFITGENICIDGGMTRQMIYHGEHGWSYDEDK